MAGFEAACVSVALARMRGRRDPRMRDVEAARDRRDQVRARSSSRGAASGVVSDVPLALSSNEDVERMFWVYGLRGRPSRMVVEVLGDLLDASSTWGGDLRPRLGDATT